MRFDAVIVAALCDTCGLSLDPRHVKYDDALDPERDFESRTEWPVPVRTAAIHGRSFAHMELGRRDNCGRVLLAVEPLEAQS